MTEVDFTLHVWGYRFSIMFTYAHISRKLLCCFLFWFKLIRKWLSSKSNLPAVLLLWKACYRHEPLVYFTFPISIRFVRSQAFMAQSNKLFGKDISFATFTCVLASMFCCAITQKSIRSPHFYKYKSGRFTLHGTFLCNCLLQWSLWCISSQKWLGSVIHVSGFLWSLGSYG